MSIDNQIEIYITIVAFEDFSLRLDGADNLLQVLQLLRLYVCGLIEKDDVTAQEALAEIQGNVKPPE